MSHFELTSSRAPRSIRGLGGWDPFESLVKREERKKAKDLAKIASAQAIEEAKIAAQRERERELRDRRIAQIQSTAEEAGRLSKLVVGKIRQLRERVEQERKIPAALAEEALIVLPSFEQQVQAVAISAGSINPFTENPAEQQAILTELQTGIQLVRGISSRLRALESQVDEAVKKANADELRLDRLLKEKQKLEARERARIESLARQQASAQRIATIQSESRAREQQIAREREIEIERAALKRAQAELRALRQRALLTLRMGTA